MTKTTVRKAKGTPKKPTARQAVAARKPAARKPAAPKKRPAAKKPAAVRKPAAAKRRAARGPLDLVRQYAKCFEAARAPAVVRLPAVNCLALEGRGAPESREFQEAIGAMYGVAYTLKFAKKAAGVDYKVPPLEALWWSDDHLARLEDSRALWRVPRQLWRWKLLLLLPEFVTSEDVRSARQTLSDKRGGDPLPQRARLERIEEGTCVQVLHVGPYADEPETVRKMQALMRERGLTPCGLHHEIYLGDPRRSTPAKLRTILRQPVR
jgi:hypothetical protein